MRGTVTSFDKHVGLGEITRDDDGWCPSTASSSPTAAATSRRRDVEFD
jgi:hypothetical protein